MGNTEEIENNSLPFFKIVSCKIHFKISLRRGLTKETTLLRLLPKLSLSATISPFHHIFL
jgi:hypothetical protein